MTDYQPLISRAVEGLGKSTGEARRTLYERARSALVAQLRAVEPALSESDITRERLSLEEAIRKVEAEAARKNRTEARAEPRFEPRPLKPSMRKAAADTPAAPAAVAPPPVAPALPRRERPEAALDRTPLSTRADANAGEAQRTSDETMQAEAERPATPASARSRLLSARMAPLRPEGLKGFRNVVNEVDDLGAATAKAAQSARDTRDSYQSTPSRRPPAVEAPAPPPPSPSRFEPRLDDEALRSLDDEIPELRSLEPAFDAEEEQPIFTPVRPARPRPPQAAVLEEEYGTARPPRSYRGLLKLAAVLAVLGILGAALSWQWPNISHFVAQLKSKPPVQTEQTQTSEPKFPGRVPQEQNPGQAPSTGAPGSQTAPAVAQRVVLYEEDPNDPQGRRFVGSAIWRTQTVSPGPGLAPELAVHADIAIPDRHMTVTWSLRRNTDPALPASHTIEIMFNLPADFPGGGISNVPGILMKQAEQARGTPLAGLAVKVTTNFFLIGLSAVDADQQRNIQLLKDQEWFDIPIVYTNGGRAILAVEKGPPGDRAFADAFTAWGK
jgi:hypothetical protein